MHLESAKFVIIGIFLYKNFKYEPYLCNVCLDLMQKSMKFNNVAIVSIRGNDYRIHFWHMSKDDAVNIMNNSNLIAIFFFII